MRSRNLQKCTAHCARSCQCLKQLLDTSLHRCFPERMPEQNLAFWTDRSDFSHQYGAKFDDQNRKMAKNGLLCSRSRRRRSSSLSASNHFRVLWKRDSKRAINDDLKNSCLLRLDLWGFAFVNKYKWCRCLSKPFMPSRFFWKGFFFLHFSRVFTHFFQS